MSIEGKKPREGRIHLNLWLKISLSHHHVSFLEKLGFKFSGDGSVQISKQEKFFQL